MTQTKINFTYHRPTHSFDGTPYEAASQAVEQTRKVTALLYRAIQDAEIQVRNAWMQRNLDAGDEPLAELWEASPEARNIAAIKAEVKLVHTKLRVIGQAAEFDPNSPD